MKAGVGVDGGVPFADTVFEVNAFPAFSFSLCLPPFSCLSFCRYLFIIFVFVFVVERLAIGKRQSKRLCCRQSGLDTPVERGGEYDLRDGVGAGTGWRGEKGC